jgi:transcriptional regulator with XRE-family HTH domain
MTGSTPETLMASFGENLRRERELRGIALHDIAEATKISVRFLQALEQDRIDLLPGGIFRRAFVRQYARYVGLDPEKLVAEFLYAHGGEEPPESGPRTARRRGSPPWGALSIAAIAIGAGVVLLARGGADGREAAAAAAAPPVSTAPLKPPVSYPTDRVYPPPSSTHPGTQAAAMEGPPAEAAGSEGNGLVLTLSARDTCWVRALVDGGVVLDKILHEGETETVSAQGEIVLSVGNAGGVSFRVNDRPGVSLGRAGEVRKNIVITRKSLPSFVQEVAPVGLAHSG